MTRCKPTTAASPVAHGSSHTPVNKSELRQFFATVSDLVKQAEAKQHRLDKKEATGFNIFDFIEPGENRLSDILKSLLDPQGGHGQSDLFLRLFFKQLGLRLDAGLTKDATVQREAHTHRNKNPLRSMDVLVDAGTLVAIENKKDAPDQPNQVKDYLSHLDAEAQARKVEAALIYLTPTGKAPEPKSLPANEAKQQEACGRLHLWSYQKELRAWLESCHRECKADKIRHFLKDFISYIKSELKRDLETDTKENQMKPNPIQEFILKNELNLRVGVTVAEAWLEARDKLSSEFLKRLDTRLKRELRGWESEPWGGEFFVDQYPGYYFWKPAWKGRYSIGLQCGNYGKSMDFGIGRDSEDTCKQPYRDELLVAMREVYPSAQHYPSWEARVSMRSPARDWRDPKILLRMHTDKEFLNEVAEHLLAVANLSASLIDRLVRRKLLINQDHIAS